jgi:hypothetical protein
MLRQSKTILLTTTIFGIILLTEIAIGQFFPKLTFINGNLTIANRIFSYLTFSIFILSIAILFKANKMLTIPLGILLFLIFIIISYSEIYPIDTTTQPVDISILKTFDNGNKLIVREYKNAKTNQIIQDTVLVKDTFIFRQIIEKKQKKRTANFVLLPAGVTAEDCK